MNTPVFAEHALKLEEAQELLAHAKRRADTLKNKQISSELSAQELNDLLDTYEQLTREIDTATALAEAATLAHTDDEQALARKKRAQSTARDIHEELLEFTLSLARLDGLEEYAQQLPEYQYYLQQLAKHKDYLLDEQTERLISIKDRTGSDVLQRVYTMITSGWEYTLKIEGEQRTMGRGELMQHTRSQQRDVRRRATQALREPIKEDKMVLAEIYNSVVKEWRNEHLQLRGYETAISPRHQKNDITQETYHALKDAVQERNDIFNEFLKHKQELLGIDELHGYDVHAPISGLPSDISYAHAKQEILAAFADLADWMHDTAQHVLESGRVDAQPRSNKYSGACCFAIAPGEDPVIIANYNGTYDDMSSIAHETGHAVHDLLAQEHNTLTFQAPLVLAETASNIAETLLFEHRYAQADTQERRALLNERISGLLGSIPTQLRYTDFETYAHNNPDATTATLEEKWSELASTDLPVVTRTTEPISWLAIPHIYKSPFYCYSYSFGALLSLSLYENFTKSGDAQPIKKLLAAGGSKNPQALLEELGYDITSKEFWNAGMDRIQTLVQRFTSL